MNQTTFTVLARSEQIYIPTRLLTGEVLTDDTQTTSAKLSGTARVLAPPARVRQSLDVYEAVRKAAGPAEAYQPAAISAGTYSSPAIFRREEFEGRP